MKHIILALAFFIASGTCLAGAWGTGSFENDDALDWMAVCTHSQGPGVIASALQAALKPGAIDAEVGASAVAAAEIVAVSSGRPGPALPPELRDWLKRQQASEVAKLGGLAQKALARIKEPKASELRQS